MIQLSQDSKNSLTRRPKGRAKNVAPQPVSNTPNPNGYEYPVTIPGEFEIVPVRTLVRLTIVRGNGGGEMYNPASLLDASLLAAPLLLRNWRAGDRMRPVHRGSEEKLKRLFQENKIPAEKRPLWPVLTSGNRIVWAKELGVAAEFVGLGTELVRIEVEEMPHPGDRS